jgi:hypothetical protein
MLVFALFFVAITGMPTTTHNGVSFEVGSEPMPSREIGARETTGRAKLHYTTTTSFYEDECNTFEKAILGYSIQDPVNADRLKRFYPLRWPYRNQGSLDALSLSLPSLGKVAKENVVSQSTDGPVVNMAGYSYWPSAPRYHYECSFGSLPYTRFMTDAEAYAGPSPPRELGRFIRVYEQAVPREFRTPDFGFVRADKPDQEVLKVGFVPFIQAEVIYTWYQVPYPDCIPFLTIEDTYLKVNKFDFDYDFMSVGYPAGTLLLTKTGPLDNWYFGPGGLKYVDVVYYFTYNPVGWNKYRLADNKIVNLHRKNVVDSNGNPIPPYLSSDFKILFDPAYP